MKPKQERFAQEYLLDLNATQAAIRAGYSPRSAEVTGARLLGNAKVAARIADMMRERSERTQITQDQVLTRFWDIATANPNDLVEFRRTCCRFCYGEKHGYQRTPREPTDSGTDGFDARRTPNPSCPECHGEGRGEVFVKDSRQLSPQALSLYAGVRVTKDGLEVKMHDQQGALVNVAKHLGMFTEKHEHTGKGGGPFQQQLTQVHVYLPDNGRDSRA